MVAFIKKVTSLPVGRWLVINLFALVFTFQIFLIVRWTVLYHVLRGLWIALLLLLVLGVVRLVRKDKLFLICLIFILVIRVPYYIHPDGLLFNSDNALEALQPLEIQDHHAAPFFLLDSSSHNGTLKYLCLAFLYEFFGSGYLVFLLFQLVIFMGLIYLVYDCLRPAFDGKTVLMLVFLHFAFIEVLFDYSLFLRGGPYLEMLFFFVLGARLMDFSFRDKRRVFLAVYFFMTSVYLHSLGLFLVIPFLLSAALYSVKSRSVGRLAGALAAGLAAGQFHFVYYRLFYPKPPSIPVYEIRFFHLSEFALSRIPAYVGQVLRDFYVSFYNILSFEFTYHYQNRGSFEYSFRSPATAQTLFILNRILIYFSLLVVLAALALVLTRLVRGRFFGASGKDRMYPFYLFLLLIILGRMFLISPAPHFEPRHNMDVAFLLALSYVIVFAAILEGTKLFSWRRLLAAGLMLAMTAPHYFSFLRVAAFKRDSYRDIMPVLEANGVKYLSTDFGLAYVIHLLSKRRIYVSDTIGPVTFPVFYPRMRDRVDRVPLEHKAYLFYTNAFPREYYFRVLCRELFESVRDELLRRGKRFKIVRLKYYVFLIPKESRVYKGGDLP